MTKTSPHDLEDDDKTASDLDCSGVETTDGLTTTNDVDCQQLDIFHPVLPSRKNTVSYNLCKNPQPSYKMLSSQARV